jgi:hypothetical protein
MSLVSGQNFVAPLKSPTHLITIVLVAMLVGAFRYSGGSIHVVSKGEAYNPAESNRMEDSVLDQGDVYDSNLDTQVSGDDILDDIRKPAAKNSESAQSKKSLLDIQKELGLR